MKYLVEVDGNRFYESYERTFNKQAAVEFGRMHSGVVWQIPEKGLPVLIDDFSQPEDKGTRDGGYADE